MKRERDKWGKEALSREGAVARQVTFFLLLTGLGLVSCETSSGTGKGTTPNNVSVKTGAGNLNTYRIQPLDTLQITVFQEADLSVKPKVSPQGIINYPLLGEVIVVGLTIAEAEAKIAQGLAKGYLVNPKVNITVEGNASRRVVVLGQVKQPGSFDMPLDETITVLQAIARAGGFTNVAATSKVRIIRSVNGKETFLSVNAEAIMKGNPKYPDIALQPGDVISVPESLF